MEHSHLQIGLEILKRTNLGHTARSPLPTSSYTWWTGNPQKRCMDQLWHHGIFSAWEAFRVILPHTYYGTILLKQFLQSFNWNLQQYKGIFLHRIFREPAPKVSRWTNWDVRTVVCRVGHYLDGLGQDREAQIQHWPLLQIITGGNQSSWTK